MKHEKSPPRRARHLRGCKSGYEIITNFTISNNTTEYISNADTSREKNI